MIIITIAICGCGVLPSLLEGHSSVLIYISGGSVVVGVTVEDASVLCAELSASRYDSPDDCERRWENAVPDGVAFFITPVQSVQIDDFYMDRYEVTVALYESCVEADVCNGDVLQYVYDFSPPESPNEPMRYLSYYDAQAYCVWRGGRLPTEVEWEYAARGSESYSFPWGNEFDGTLLNFCDINCEANTMADIRWDDGFAQIALVDAFQGDRSWAGVIGLAGNVAEWTSTIYSEQSDDGERVVKGGNYLSFSYRAASWNRFPMRENEIREGIGFRCVYNVES
ncbi:MAG: formylglycine-generating enzyme family protein [Aggregatilineales bacterium]